MVSGWGTLKSGGQQPNILQKVTVKVLEKDECGHYAPSAITANMMCAGEEGKDSCQGDSGGPLIAPENGRQALVRPLDNEIA